MMNLRKLYFIVAVALLVFPLAVTPAMAGGDIPRPTDGAIHGPDLWGVVVIGNCSLTPTATLRVKQIGADCLVGQQAIWMNIGSNCPTAESDVLYYELGGVQLNDAKGVAINDPSTTSPIFVRIKNFWTEADGTASFDVLINFITR